MRLFLLSSALALVACATPGAAKGGSPMTFVLVHGAFADAHAFDGVKPALEAKGHRVLAPDLPGHGRDTTPPAEVSLERYVDAIDAVVNAQSGPVVLVGHSMAGMVVAQVAERSPQRIKQLVFVAAYLPQSGQSLEELAKTDAASLVGQNLQLAADYSTATLRKEAIAEALAADLPPALQGLIVAGQKPEPLAPFRGKVTLTTAGFGAVPKSYVLTANDRAVSPALQAQMVSSWPGTRTVTLETSHLPFLAQPDAFVATLLELAER